MKIFEVEGTHSHTGEVVAAVEDYLFSLKAQGVDEIPTQEVVSYMQNLGHSVDVRSLLDAIGSMSFVKNPNEQTISFGDDYQSPEQSEEIPDEEERPEKSAREKVKDLAKKSNDFTR